MVRSPGCRLPQGSCPLWASSLSSKRRPCPAPHRIILGHYLCFLHGGRAGGSQLILAVVRPSLARFVKAAKCACRLLAIQSTAACGTPLAECNFGVNMLGSFIIFFTFFWNAHLMVVYSNRFTTGDWHPAAPLHVCAKASTAPLRLAEEFGHNIWMYASMGCMSLMAVSSVDCIGSATHCASIMSSGLRGTASFGVFALAAAVTNALTGLQFMRTVYMKRVRMYSALYGGGCLVAAVAWTLGAVFATTATQHLLVAGCISIWHIAVDVATRLPSVELPTRLPEHKASRFRKFGVVMLTQLLMGVLSPGAAYNTRGYVFAAGVLALTMLHKTVHYDFNQGHKADGWSGVPRISEWLYVMMNLVLAGTFTALGAVVHAIITDVTNPAIAISPARALRVKWMLCSAMALALFASIAIQTLLRGKGKRVRRCGKKVRMSFRTLLALVTLLAPVYLPETFPSEHVIWILVAVVAVELVGDIIGKQQVNPAEGAGGVIPHLDVYSEAVGLEDAAAGRRKTKAAATFQAAMWRVVSEGGGKGTADDPSIQAPLLGRAPSQPEAQG